MSVERDPANFLTIPSVFIHDTFNVSQFRPDSHFPYNSSFHAIFSHDARGPAQIVLTSIDKGAGRKPERREAEEESADRHRDK